MKIAKVTISKKNEIFKSSCICVNNPFDINGHYKQIIDLLIAEGFEKVCNHTFSKKEMQIEFRTQEIEHFSIKDIHLLEQNENVLSNSFLHFCFDNSVALKNRIVKTLHKK